MRARDNPFNTENILKFRYTFSNITWEDFMFRLEKSNYRGAIIGPHGMGKTTLLEDLEPKIIELGFNVKNLRLTSNNRIFCPDFLKNFYEELTNKDIILFDGAEQLSWLSWQNLNRKTSIAAGLIITTHRKGMLPEIYECTTSFELLDDILRELIPQGFEKIKDQARLLYNKHNGNIREILREFYDIYASKDFFSL